MNYQNQIILGYLTSDFLISGVHWFEDTYLDPVKIKNKTLKDIALSNDLHHFYPRSILSKGFWESFKIPFILTIVAILFIYIFFKKFFRKNKLFIFTVFLFLSFSNNIHKWTHMRDHESNLFIKGLQKTGIIVTHNEHRIHHAIDSRKKWGVLNSYTNIFYDYFKVWQLFEFVVEKLFKIKSSKKGIVKDYVKAYDNELKESLLKATPKIIDNDIIEKYYKKKLLTLLENNVFNNVFNI